MDELLSWIFILTMCVVQHLNLLAFLQAHCAVANIDVRTEQFHTLRYWGSLVFFRDSSVKVSISVYHLVELLEIDLKFWASHPTFKTFLYGLFSLKYNGSYIFMMTPLALWPTRKLYFWCEWYLFFGGVAI